MHAWLRSGTFVLAATTVATLALRIGSSLVLARMLSPEIFGYVGIVLSAAAILTLVTDMGFQAFIIRHTRGEESRFLDSIWTIRLARSVAIAAFVAIAAPWIASAYGRPETGPAIMILAIIFVLEGATSLGIISAIRREQGGFVSVFEFLMACASTLLLIVFTYHMRDEWGFLLGLVAGAAVRTVASYVFFPDAVRRLALDRPAAKELLAFAKIVIPSSVLTLFLTQVDKLALSRVLDLKEFGLYILATTIVAGLASFSTAYTSRFAYPSFARLDREDPNTLKAKYYSLRAHVTIPFVFLIGGIAGGSDFIIRFLFDDRYLDAARYLALLSLAPAFSYNMTCAEACLVAKGQIHQVLNLNVARTVYVILCGSIGYYFFGPIGFVFAIATLDVPPMLIAWGALRKLGILRLSQEALFLALLVLGYGMGWAFDDTMKNFIEGVWIPAL